MNPKKQPFARVLGILVLGAALSGCNYNRANDGVRAGPQAVHPSTSALAQGAVAVAPVVTTSCGGLGEAPCTPDAAYTPVPGDGSQPIID